MRVGILALAFAAVSHLAPSRVYPTSCLPSARPSLELQPTWRLWYPKGAEPSPVPNTSFLAIPELGAKALSLGLYLVAPKEGWGWLVTGLMEDTG